MTTLFRGLFTSCGREGIFCAGYMGLGPVFSEGLRSRFGVEKKVGGLSLTFSLAHGSSCAFFQSGTLHIFGL